MRMLNNTLLAVALLAFASCKKDKADGPENLNGNYVLYEIEQYSPARVTPMPNTKGDYGNLIVKTGGINQDATVRLQLFDKDKKVLADTTYICVLKKDADDILMLANKTSNTRAAYFDDNEMDFYSLPNFRIAGRK